MANNTPPKPPPKILPSPRPQTPSRPVGGNKTSNGGLANDSQFVRSAGPTTGKGGRPPPVKK